VISEPKCFSNGAAGGAAVQLRFALASVDQRQR
jgi:hypothetical protein